MWTSDGVLIEESHFLNGELHGTYRTWWKNGMPKEVGGYVAGERVATYRWFDQKGGLLQEHDYGDPRDSASCEARQFCGRGVGGASEAWCV